MGIWERTKMFGFRYLRATFQYCSKSRFLNLWISSEASSFRSHIKINAYGLVVCDPLQAPTPEATRPSPRMLQGAHKLGANSYESICCHNCQSYSPWRSPLDVRGQMPHGPTRWPDKSHSRRKWIPMRQSVLVLLIVCLSVCLSCSRKRNNSRRYDSILFSRLSWWWGGAEEWR